MNKELLKFLYDFTPKNHIKECIKDKEFGAKLTNTSGNRPYWTKEVLVGWLHVSEDNVYISVPYYDDIGFKKYMAPYVTYTQLIKTSKLYSCTYTIYQITGLKNE